MASSSDPPSLGAVLWDVDGVIVDSAPYHLRAWQQAFAGIGVPMDRETFYRTFGQRNDAIIAQVLGPAVPKEQEEAIATAKEECYREIVVREGIQALPGALEWIHRLHDRGIPQAVASSAPPANTATILQALRLTGVFQALVSGEEVPCGKPDPAIFILAANKLGVPPRYCVVVEDAPAGIEAAKRGGMACLAVTTSHPADRLGGADLVAGSLAELPEDAFDRLITAWATTHTGPKKNAATTDKRSGKR